MQMRKGAFLWTLAFLASHLGGVLAQSDDTSLDILKGKNGESSCELKDKIYDGCGITPASNATYEKPASCTCNREFFNIMSACAYSSGIALPTFSEWMSTCSISGMNLEQSQSLAEIDSWNVASPDWARLAVPGNKTMDLQQAVVLAHSGPKKATWTALQVILPIITAIVAILVTVLSMTIYQRHLAHARLGPRFQRFIRPVPRVKSMDAHDAEAWEIEPSGKGYGYGVAGRSKDGETYPFTDIPHSASIERDEIFVAPKSPIYSDKDSPVVTSLPSEGTALRSPPAGGVYPFGPTAAPQVQAQLGKPQPLFKTDQRKPSMDQGHQRNASSGSAFGAIVNAMPWKKQPPKITEVTPGRGFDINDIDHTTQAESSQRSTYGFGSTPTDLKSMDFHDRTLEESDNGHVLLSAAAVNSNTLSTSLDSDIRIVSPTTDSSPRNTFAAGNIVNANSAMPPSIPPIPALPTIQPFSPPQTAQSARGPKSRPLPPSPPLQRQQSTNSSVSDIYGDPFSDTHRR